MSSELLTAEADGSRGGPRSRGTPRACGRKARRAHGPINRWWVQTRRWASLFGKKMTLSSYVLGALGVLLTFLAVSGAIIWWPGLRALVTGPASRTIGEPLTREFVAPVTVFVLLYSALLGCWGLLCSARRVGLGAGYLGSLFMLEAMLVPRAGLELAGLARAGGFGRGTPSRWYTPAIWSPLSRYCRRCLPSPGYRPGQGTAERTPMPSERGSRPGTTRSRWSAAWRSRS